jgi:hypothetical protein
LHVPAAWEPPLQDNISTITININITIFNFAYSGGVGATVARGTSTLSHLSEKLRVFSGFYP